MKILALSYLFPNLKNPSYGVFVLNRLKAVQKTCVLKVIAPLQWYPFVDRFRRAARGSEVPEVEEIEGVQVFHPRFPTIPKFFKWFDSISYLFSVWPIVHRLRKQEQFDFDIVDVHWTYPDILAGYVIAKFYGKKLIVTIRGKEALCLGERGGRKFILDTLLKRADFVVTLSTELKELVQQIGVVPERAKVILNGVDAGHFHLDDKDLCRERLGISKDKKVILSVGSLIRRKGHHELIKIMPGLARDFDVALYLVGGVSPEGDYRAELKKMVSDRGLNNVHFIDKIDHDGLKDWYAASDVFGLATSGEGCPNVVLEALACGTPVVVSDVGAVSDLVRPGEDGFVVDINSGDSFDGPVREALSRAWDRSDISQRVAQMTWACCADKVLDIYRSVVEAPTLSAQSFRDPSK